MKILALIMAAVLFAVTPATPQVFDLSTIKCKEFVESSKEHIALILMWLEGFYAEDDSPPVIDLDKMKSHAQQLGTYCQENPTEELMAAAESVMGK